MSTRTPTAWYDLLDFCLAGSWRRRRREAYGNGDEDTNGDTGCNSQSSLSVVLRGKEFGVLQCSVGLVVSVELHRHATVD